MPSSTASSFFQLIFIFYNIILPFSSGTGRDTLYPNQFMSDGQTLTSAAGNFELGFFSPGRSKNRYLGIWYDTNHIPHKTVVWVANRNFPITDTSGSLLINGSLAILDNVGDTFYISDTLFSNKFVTAQLLDNGNFVLKQGSSVLWQSFDDPTDTILPGMKMSPGRQLISWQSSDNPEEGNYSWQLDSNCSFGFNLRQREKNTYWMSGPWNGGSFALIPEMESNSLYNYSCVVDKTKELIFSYGVVDKADMTRIVMDFSGNISQLVWSTNSKKWEVSWSRPENPCQVPNVCGAFGLCNSDKPPFKCQCLEGFEPTFDTDWDVGAWSGGCTRRTPLTCDKNATIHGGKNDLFLNVSCIKLPSNSKSILAQNGDECKRICMDSCSCTAYSSGSNCSLWHGDLLNLQQSSHSDEVIYLRLAPSKMKKGRRWLWGILAGVAALASFLMGICLWQLLRRKRTKQEIINHVSTEATRNEEIENNVGFDQPGPKELCDNAYKLNYKEDKNPALPLYSYATVSAATNNFSDANKLGQGGFGPVYKGKLKDGQVVAVKRLSRTSGQGLEEFKNEVILIAKLQHVNLVRLLGCCIDEGEKILLYEFMPNKSLDTFIFCSRRQKLFDWRKRVQIIEGIAHGLLYLHKYSRLKIIHRDLKASNILLDKKLVPKIADFGMARIFGRNESQASTKRIVGTYGYMPPEYAMGGVYSEKSDVFSYGVLLLEIVSGKRNGSFYNIELCLTLIGYAWELFKHGRVLEMVDPKLGASPPTEEVHRCVHVALLCVQNIAKDRPTMADVVAMLSNEAASLTAPKDPAFIFRQPEVAYVNGCEVCSNNEVTHSAMEPR